MFSLSRKTHTSVSITEGTIWKTILVFFFPILLGTFFQQLYNTVDAVVVGRFVGKSALAAVGGGSAVFVNLLVGFFVGLTSGAGVLISQFYGAENKNAISISVHTSIALCIAGGILMTAVGICSSDAALTLTKTPQDIFHESSLYLKIYFTGMVPMFIYNMGSGILRAVGDSRTPLIILIIGCVSNIVLDILLVLVFSLGVTGVALATVICQAESAIITLVILTRSQDSYRFEWKKLAITPHILGAIMRIGFPVGIQSSLYTISNLIIQSHINSFGTDDVAAWAAYGKIDAMFWMLINALGISVTTFAGQNYGAQKFDRMRKGMWQSLGMAVIISLASGALFMLAGRYIFLLFTTDEAVICEGMKILRFLTPFWITYISIEIISGTVHGAGVSFAPMVITIFGVCLLRIVWLFGAVPLRRNIFTVMASYPITWVITSVMFWIYYLRGKWLEPCGPGNGVRRLKR